MSDGTNATPAARELAEAHGLDLADVTPTGATGIVRADVEAAIAAAPGPAPASGAVTLRSGAYTFGAPVAGGSRVTVRAGERLPPVLFQHVPAADRALFDAAD